MTRCKKYAGAAIAVLSLCLVACTNEITDEGSPTEDVPEVGLDQAYSAEGACGWDDWLFYANILGDYVGWIRYEDQAYQAVHENLGEWWTVSYLTCTEGLQDADGVWWCWGQEVTEWWWCPLY